MSSREDSSRTTAHLSEDAQGTCLQDKVGTCHIQATNQMIRSKMIQKY